MGQVIQFPKELLPSEQTFVIKVPAKDLLEFGWPRDSYFKDDDTGEMVVDDVTLSLLQQFFRLFGIHLTGLEQADNVGRMFDALAVYRVGAIDALNGEPGSKTNRFLSRHYGKGVRAYVRAIASGDLAATKAYADKHNLRAKLVDADKSGDVVNFPQARTDRSEASGFTSLPFREHLYSAFPVEDMVYLTIEGTEHLAKPGVIDRVMDYFAAFGVDYPHGASGVALSQAWGYLSIEPGHWVDYLVRSPETYVLLKDDLSEHEQAYVQAISQNNRTAARALFEQTRWFLGLQKELRAVEKELLAEE